MSRFDAKGFAGAEGAVAAAEDEEATQEPLEGAVQKDAPTRASDKEVEGATQAGDPLVPIPLEDSVTEEDTDTLEPRRRGRMMDSDEDLGANEVGTRTGATPAGPVQMTA